MQTDPVKGASPWQRGVIAEQQILVCPLCQQTNAWRDDLDRCALCASTRLVRRLGETSCLECQRTGAPLPGPARGGVQLSGRDRPLEAQVENALQRVLGQPAGQAPGQPSD